MSPPEAEPSDAAPLPDPMKAAELSEPERGVLESFADRTRWLSGACLGAGGLGAVVSLTSLTGRVETGVVLYLVPTSIANLAFGWLLRNAAGSLGEAAKNKLRDKKPLMGAFELLSKAFVVQLFAVGFLIALLIVALIVALTFKRVTEV